MGELRAVCLEAPVKSAHPQAREEAEVKHFPQTRGESAWSPRGLPGGGAML